MNSKTTFKKGICGLVLLLFALSVSFVMSNHVYAEESDFVVDENGVLTKYNGPGGDVVIPDSVTSIGDWAFEDCSHLTAIIINNNTITIGKDLADPNITTLYGNKILRPNNMQKKMVISSDL